MSGLQQRKIIIIAEEKGKTGASLLQKISRRLALEANVALHCGVSDGGEAEIVCCDYRGKQMLKQQRDPRPRGKKNSSDNYYVICTTHKIRGIK